MNSIVAWDALERAVDHLADILQGLLDRPDELLCSLDYDEAAALADVLDAGHHTDTARRLMHRWALSEPDWADQHEHALREWLAPERPTSLRSSFARLDA